MSTTTDPNDANPSKTSRWKNWLISTRRFLSENKIFVELIGLTAALAVLWTYYRANQLAESAIALNRQSLELNQKQMMSAYVPWLSITDLVFDLPNNRITYNVHNDSNAPAFVTAMLVDYAGKDPLVNVISRPQRPKQKLVVAPHSVLQVVTNPSDDATPIQMVKDAFYAGRISIKLTLNYDDPFHRHFSIAITADPRGNGTNEIILSRAEMTGLDQLK